MNIEQLKERLVGKRVVRVEKSTGHEGWDAADGSLLVLDDGTTVDVWQSEADCCAAASGDWVLKADNLDAAITNVTYETSSSPADDDDDDFTMNFAKITVLHNQNVIALADCSANDGNGGYYYSVLSLRVSVPGEQAVDMTVVEA